MLLLFTALSALGPSAAVPAKVDRPPVQIWMNNDRRFREGDRVQLQIDADVDGFLLVLNHDTDGRLRVLFPLDPRDDARVVAGRRYEVRDAGGSSAFRASTDGNGLIYTAIAQEPWHFDDVVLADRWDYTKLTIDPNSDNPEAAITDLVQQLSGPGGFDYDVAGFRVYGTTSYSSYDDYYARGPIYVYDDYLYCNNWTWRYNGCRRWPFDGGWSLGFYGYGSRPYGYGYNPYVPYYPYRPGPSGRGPVIAGRSRSYNVIPRSGVGTGGFGRSVGTARGPSGVGSPPPINWRPRSVARPSGGRSAEAGRGSGQGTVTAPPARRARGEGGGNSEASARGNGRGSPRSNDPPQRADPPSSKGGNDRGNNGGGHSAPPPSHSRPRRP